MSLRTDRRTLLTGGAVVALMFAPLRRLFAGADTHETLDAFLLVFLQRLFPHPQIPEAIYRSVAERLGAAVRNDAALSALVRDGRRQLDQGATVPWLQTDEIRQTARLREVEDTAFFQTIRGMGSFSFYGNPDVWPFFGYEGSSVEKGGYLARGFDDLDWLPDPET